VSEQDAEIQKKPRTKRSQTTYIVLMMNPEDKLNAKVVFEGKAKSAIEAGSKLPPGLAEGQYDVIVASVRSSERVVVETRQVVTRKAK
jgi:hypothetical protein